MKHSFFSFAAGLVLTLGTTHALAQTAGSLDSTFGTAGKAVFTLPSHSLEARDTAVAADGSIYVLGTAQATDAPEFRPIVAKFTAAGALDTTFGPGGYVLLPLSLDYHGRALVIAPDGSLRIGGQNQVTFVVTALTSSGALLTDFGTGGIATIVVGPRAEVRDMGIQSTGAIVLVGHADWIDTAGTASTRTAMYLARFTSAGVADTTFGTAGVAVYTPPTGSHSGSCLQVLPDDKLLVGGDTGTAASATGVLARFTATNGALDTTFDSDGLWSNPALGAIVALTAESTGRMTLLAKALGGQGLTMARLTTFALLDTTFSTDGLASFTATETPGALAIRSSDARIFVAGAHSNAGTTAYSLRRIQPDGATDANFNTGSPVLTTMGSNFGDTVSNLIRLSDGKLLMVGHTRVAATNMTMSFGLARFHPGADETNVAPPTITTHPANQTVARGTTATFSVEHTGPAASYQWFRNGSPISSSNSRFLNLSTTTVDAQAAYSVTITNAYGSITSNAGTLSITVSLSTVSDPLQDIVSVLGQEGQQTFTAAGVPPMTFTWRKGSTVVFTEVITRTFDFLGSSSIGFQGLASEAGSYTCTVTSAQGSVTSNSFSVRYLPLNTLSLEPADQLLSVGDALSITANLTTIDPLGMRTFQHEWKKDTKLLPISTNKISSSAAAFTDGGTYTCRVGTLAGISSTATARVAIVESSDRFVAAAAGKAVTLTALTTGPGLAYRWHYTSDGTALTNGGRITGADKATLSISAANALTDSQDYYCEVTSAWGESILTGDITLVVESVKPTVAPITFEHGRVGLPYTATVTADHTTQKYAATGLPTGLTLNTTTGEITGTPTAPGTYSVKLTATNPVGTSAVLTAPLVINPLTVQGTYTGLVRGDLGYIGTFSMTVAPNGTYTGKAIVGVFNGALHTLSFSGAFSSTVDAPDTNVSDSLPIPVPSVFADGPYILRMSQSGANDLQAKLISTTGTEFEMSAYRNPWNATSNPATAFVGYHTFGLGTTLAATASGSGYGWVTTTTAGTFSMAGKLPDNTALTMSGIFEGPGHAWFFQWLYGNKGKLAGGFQFQEGTGPLYSDIAITGTLEWTRPPLSTIPAGSIDTPYATGFENHQVSIAGARYLRPGHPDTTSNLMLDAVAGDDNITASLSGGHLDFNFYDGSPIDGGTLSSLGTLRTTHAATFPAWFPGDVNNPPDSIRFNSLAFNVNTGTYTGSATAYQVIDIEQADGSFKTYLSSTPIALQGIATRSDPTSSAGFGTGFFNYNVPFGLFDADGRLIKTVSILVSGDSAVSPGGF